MKRFLLVFIVFLIVILSVSHYLVNIRHARSLISAEIGIKPVNITTLRQQLIDSGCTTDSSFGDCYFIDRQLNHPQIEVYPQGPGFGPVSFLVTEDKIIVTKDIPGFPNINIFKKEVISDLSALKNFVSIKPGSWKITEIKFPWLVVY